MFHRVLGKATAPLDPAWLRGEIARHQAVLLDVGAGDGRFVLDAAKASPATFCIGLDAAADNLAESARKAARSKADNVLFLRGAAEELPGPLASVADQLTVNYPWGSLLRIVARPEPEHLAKLRAVCKPGADVVILINYSVFEDAEYLQRIGLAEAADLATSPALAQAYRRSGFAIRERRVFAGDPAVRTAWGRHLVRGSSRKTLAVEAVAA